MRGNAVPRRSDDGRLHGTRLAQGYGEAKSITHNSLAGGVRLANQDLLHSSLLGGMVDDGLTTVRPR